MVLAASGHQRGVKAIGAWFYGVLLVGCGAHVESSAANGGTSGTAGGTSSAAGASADAAAPAGGTSAGGADVSEPGQAGEAGEAVPDISGRWAMVLFEDPVGLQVVQRGSQLSGKGCDVGAPPLQDETRDLCGPLMGAIRPSGAAFGFTFTSGVQYQYLAKDVTVSADGQRMTGHFHGSYDWMPFPVAWLRLADDEAWLPYPEQPEPYRQGVYDLRLTDADGDEYSNEQVYIVHFVFGSFNGPFGSFWHTEIHRDTPDGPLLVGPVPMTQPELAVSLSVDVKDGHFTRFQALTGSGHHYTFSASVEAAP